MPVIKGNVSIFTFMTGIMKTLNIDIMISLVHQASAEPVKPCFVFKVLFMAQNRDKYV